MGKRPSGYRVLTCCANCALVFKRYEYDESPSYYCHADRSERPLCMSVAMDECPRAKERDLHRVWTEWSRGRRVEAWAICDEYIREQEDDE